ncbi:hypothetical protein DEU56DRAFT_754804 [Suillus clintonianus]|uniref:uncharacterized protein n=1 Tax=Suillus clintonianus TaxID=1904413 RepID=UPI001B868CF5|nr:uncharacterized protein DEU56DRAFT_754804 [Suillus clintonianus]KAG2141822.1 hypothetical protein DEU56DRAFT_754804 [Suillus clintonianus]
MCKGGCSMLTLTCPNERLLEEIRSFEITSPVLHVGAAKRDMLGYAANIMTPVPTVTSFQRPKSSSAGGDSNVTVPKKAQGHSVKKSAYGFTSDSEGLKFNKRGWLQWPSGYVWYNATQTVNVSTVKVDDSCEINATVQHIYRYLDMINVHQRPKGFARRARSSDRDRRSAPSPRANESPRSLPRVMTETSKASLQSLSVLVLGVTKTNTEDT